MEVQLFWKAYLIDVGLLHPVGGINEIQLLQLDADISDRSGDIGSSTFIRNDHITRKFRLWEVKFDLHLRSWRQPRIVYVEEWNEGTHLELKVTGEHTDHVFQDRVSVSFKGFQRYGGRSFQGKVALDIWTVCGIVAFEGVSFSSFGTIFIAGERNAF